MHLFGLHWFDCLLIVGYVVGILFIGKMVARGTHTEDDFFLGGRKLGRWFQFFLNFGNMTDPSAATATASSVYREGIGGVWITLITLLFTPYYWFMNVWFRRARLTTMADLFEARFGSKLLATLYAFVNIVMAVLLIGFGNIVALKTLQPIMTKGDAQMTAPEREMTVRYQRFAQLRGDARRTPLVGAELAEYEPLRELHERGQLFPYVSHLRPLPFYLASSLLVAFFIMLGGLTASAVVDAIQALLVIAISVVLIPFGLARVGGFGGLHATVPEQMFDVFGGDTSEYTWYSIAALLLMSVIGINAAQGNMNISGSAKNEMAARLGAVTGGFSKRFVTIAWGLCGLIAIALFGRNLSDPDQAWGLLTRTLLPVGLIGLMIIGILGGKLAALGASSVVVSGLFVKNLYEPIVRGRPDRHYLLVARLTVPVLLGLGVLVALSMSNAISLIKFVMTFAVVWGAPILLIFKWRRLTETAVLVQVVVSMLFIGVVPAVISSIPSLRRSPAWTVMTPAATQSRTVQATAADVAAGLAAAPGERFIRQEQVQPKAVFFEDGVARVDPTKPDSPQEGLGRFNMEVYLTSLLGFDVRHFTPPQLLAARFLVDALLPVLLLIGVSLITPRTEASRADRFYARQRTPVASTPEADATAVDASEANPSHNDHHKLARGSEWELLRWDRVDVLGFLGCCFFVGFVLLFFHVLLRLGT